MPSGMDGVSHGERAHVWRSASTSAGAGRVTEERFSLATRLVCYEVAAEDRRDLLMLGFFVSVRAALIAAT
jgi:hypothetical protein